MLWYVFLKLELFFSDSNSTHEKFKLLLLGRFFKDFKNLDGSGNFEPHSFQNRLNF